MKAKPTMSQSDHYLEKQLSEILEERGWIVFENDSDAIEYGLENATDTDLDYADLVRAGSQDMLPEEMVRDLENEDYIVFEPGYKKLLTEMFNQYIMHKSIDEKLLDKLFQDTIHRNI